MVERGMRLLDDLSAIRRNIEWLIHIAQFLIHTHTHTLPLPFLLKSYFYKFSSARDTSEK